MHKFFLFLTNKGSVLDSVCGRRNMQLKSKDTGLSFRVPNQMCEFVGL